MGGNVIVVTGANRGIGFESARALARKGKKLILACRNVASGECAKTEILRSSTSAEISVLALDLASANSIKSFAEKLSSSSDRIAVLLNNAGTIMPNYRVTAEGFELTMGVNYLGQFLLTRLLLPLMAPEGARIINTSSLAMVSSLSSMATIIPQRIAC